MSAEREEKQLQSSGSDFFGNFRTDFMGCKELISCKLCMIIPASALRTLKDGGEGGGRRCKSCERGWL